MNNHKSVFLFLVLIMPISACMEFRTSPKGIGQEFEESEIKPSIKDIEFERKNFRYIELCDGSYTKPTVLFVHGAPGSSDNYFQFMKDPKMIAAFDMISVDRLGYGYSDFGNSETSLTKQAKAIRSILEEYKSSSTILVGHSYGGPIVAKAAALYPQLIQGLMLLAPAIDPENEKKVSVAWMGKTAPFKWVTPASLKVATDEKYSHVEELNKLLPDWSKLCLPITYIHGDEDSLVPYANLAFAERMISPTCLKLIGLTGEDHFLPWSQEDLIKEELYALNSEIKGSVNQIDCSQ